MKNPLFCAASLAPLALASITASHAEETAGAIDQIVVSDTRRDALAEARAYAESRPGNVVLAPAEEYERRYAVTLRDALGFAPGVVMQPTYGEEGRLSVRGSGLAQNFHLRGVELLASGVPVNTADGFGDFQEIDLLFASHINVLKGANAFRTGAATLGGAIEVEGATARNVDDRLFLRAEGGSWGSSRLHGRAAGVQGDVDALVAGTWQRQDGFRDHARQRNERLYANFGVKWSERAETRIGLYVNDIDQEIPGLLSLSDALGDPRAPAAGNVAGDWQRDLETQRVFTTTRLDLGAVALAIGGAFAHKHMFHPIPVILDQDSDDYLGFARLEGEGVIFGAPISWTAGLRYRASDIDGEVYLNFAGRPGPLIGLSRQKSNALEAFGEARAELAPGLEAIAGLVWIRSERDYDDRLGDIEDDNLVFRHASPRFGLLWRARESLHLFANASASYEPPTFLDLTQAGTAGFTPIEAQDGFTYEIGARGAAGPLSFEASFYHADLAGEFVAFTATPGVPAPVFNAGDTFHRGVEAHARLALVEDWRGFSIAPRIAYAWNDFRFNGDPVYGDNRLAGVAEHVGRAELAIERGVFRLVPNIAFQAGDNFVDYANTLSSPGHVLAGVEASAEIRPGVVLFVDARNLADRAYVSSYSTIADARAAARLDLFAPGEGRAVFAGVKIGIGGAP